jgi:UTP--glucose-1-phosphate uridylyltransferase
VISPSIFDILERTPAGKGGEVQLTDALRTLNQLEDVYGYVFEGTRYDIGDKIGWLKTNFMLALDDPEMGPELRPFVSDLLEKPR